MDAQETAHRFLELFSRCDFDALRAILAEDFAIEVPFAPPGVTARREGRDVCIEYLRRSLGGAGPLSNLVFHDVETFSGGGEIVFAEFRSTGSFTSDGSAYANRYAAKFELRDGLIVLYREYLDPTPLLAGLARRQ